MGVNDYEHPHFNSLEFADNDVTDLAGVLKSQGFQVILMTTGSGEVRTQTGSGQHPQTTATPA